MKWKLDERKIILVGTGIYFCLNLSSGWMFADSSWRIRVVLLLTTLFSLLMQWEGAYQVHRFARKRHPQIARLKPRVLTQLLGVFCATFLIQLATDVVQDPLFSNNPYPVDALRLVVLALQAFGFSITAISLFEAFYNYTSLRKSESEKEELLRLNLKSKLDSLKSQVNPHFLFNSLNTLSSLIQIDAAKAEQFVEELSNVYRFLLRTNELEQITLRDELEFIQSYSHLLTTRFGTNLQVQVEVEEAYLDCLLPSLTLQLLVENAVKHNIISSEKPLTIRIYTQADQLVVVNNLQKKKREVLSEKTGLANIISKYRLLKQAEPSIKETEEAFTVALPLQKNEKYAGIDC